ncbi:hypothetical protein BDR26DRAFT_1009586 [Obelidium mucronatum]|nr:hypothetical protein BDR26DRAFT_1009586 [Obelidium mucronatum]
MSEEGVSPASTVAAAPFPPAPAYNPHSGRGRKRTLDEPISKRSGQMREAQRAHRERKKNYLFDLERKAKELETVKQRVSELELELAKTIHGVGAKSTLAPCIHCATEQFKTSLCMDQVKVLEKQVVDLKLEAEVWKARALGVAAHTPVLPIISSPSIGTFVLDQSPAASVSEGSMSMDSSTFMNQSMVPSEQLFGPMDIESTRRDLKLLPSLTGLTVADDIVNMAIAQTKVDHVGQVKRMFFNMIRLLNELFDSCSVLDRAKAAEIVAKCMQGNSHHLRYITNSWAGLLQESSTPRQPCANKANSRGFNLLRSSLLSIPSLANAQDQIDEFCQIFTHALEEQDPDGFFRVHVAISNLEALLVSVEERTRFFSAFEVAREGNRKDMETLIQKVEQTAL